MFGQTKLLSLIPDVTSMMQFEDILKQCAGILYQFEDIM